MRFYTVTVRSRAAPGRDFHGKVTTFEPAARLILTGGMPLGLFRGARTFTLAATRGDTAFRVGEECTGSLLPLIWRLRPDLGRSFPRFASRNARVESRARPTAPMVQRPDA